MLASLCAGRPPSARPPSTALAAGLAAPLLRRRLKLPPAVTIATAATAPFALCVLVPRSRARDVGTVCLQMWAYVAAYKMPNDDPEALERAGARRLPRARRPLGRARDAADAAPAARARDAGRLRALGEGARLVALDLVHRSRTAPSPTCCCATASSSRAARRRSTRPSTSA